jgi:hypothetical protein
METNVRQPAPTLLAILAVGLSLSGCGTVRGMPEQAADSAALSAPIASTAQPWQATNGDVLVTCHDSPAFPASLAAQGGLEVQPGEAEEIVDALAHLKGMGGIDAPGPLQSVEAEQVKWAVLWWDSSSEGETLGLLVAPPGSTGFSLDSDESVTLEWQDGQWRASSWSGTCGARPVLPAYSAWAQIALPADATNPAGTSVDLLVSEIQCTSARDPEPFLADPVVVETDGTVTVYWTTEQMTGDATCPSNPWVPRTIQLKGPLGDRPLLDGSTWPPARVTVADPYG